MWVVVYEDKDFGYQRCSRVFQFDAAAFAHYDALCDIHARDEGMGIKPVGVYRLTEVQDESNGTQ